MGHRRTVLCYDTCACGSLADSHTPCRGDGRRAAIRIGVVLPLLMVVAAIAVEQAPLVSVLSASVSGWMVWRLNKGGKGGKA